MQFLNINALVYCLHLGSNKISEFHYSTFAVYYLYLGYNEINIRGVHSWM